MDHTAVAGAGFKPETLIFLDYVDGQFMIGYFGRNGQPNDSGSYDGYVYFLHILNVLYAIRRIDGKLSTAGHVASNGL